MSDHVRTLHEMKRAGYKFLNHHVCKGCGADIEWWETNNGKKLPFDPMPKSDNADVTPHWASCPEADSFRRKDSGQQERKPASQSVKQTKLDVKREINRLRDASDARIIVAILEDGGVAAWRDGIPSEDLRHDLITAANNVRNHIEKESR